MKTAIIDSLQCIDSQDQRLNDIECIQQFNTLSEHHDSEIKLYTSNIKDHTASFNWVGINKWKIDCPVELHKIHRQRYATQKECIVLIKKIFQKKDLDTDDSFIDVPIRHFTLDEMLEFKEEDEMMLKGQDPDLYKTTPTPPIRPEVSKTTSAQKNNSKHSFLVGEKPNLKKETIQATPAPTLFAAKKPKTSPLQEFKKEATQLPKEDASIATKAPSQETVKKIDPPKQTKAKPVSFISMEETLNPKKEAHKTTPPVKSKETSTKLKTLSASKKPEDDSFFSI